MAHALKITGLKKRYGKKVALKGLDMRVPENSVYGFVGENGAGKTTTFSVLGGFLYPDEGAFELSGRMGMLPQDARFGSGRKIGEQLAMLARLAGTPGSDVETEVRRVLKIVELEDQIKLAVEKCSHGMYKRVGIAQALLGDPDLLLFDEPTAGLDPKHAHDIRQLIASLSRNRTVVISSHNLAEIAQMCDHVGIIHLGEMRFEGPVSTLTHQSSVINLELSHQPEVNRLRELKGVMAVDWTEEKSLCQVEFDRNGFSVEEMNAQLLDHLLKEKIGVRSITLGRSLEGEFLKTLRVES